jgi:hypothetical protein
MQKIEKLQGELASATASIAELEKGKAAAQAAQKEAAKARRDAETARREIEQAAATERAKLQKRLAQLEADGTAPAKNKRWENDLYGSMGGLLIVLIASEIGFFSSDITLAPRDGRTDTSAQFRATRRKSGRSLHLRLPSRRTRLERLEKQVAVLNATQMKPARNQNRDGSQLETPAAEKAIRRSNQLCGMKDSAAGHRHHTILAPAKERRIASPSIWHRMWERGGNASPTKNKDPEASAQERSGRLDIADLFAASLIKLDRYS